MKEENVRTWRVKIEPVFLFPDEKKRREKMRKYIYFFIKIKTL